MKPSRIISLILLFTIFYSGCEQSTAPNETTAKTNNDNDTDKLSFYTLYAPTKIDIMPLTELVGPGNTPQSKISIYVSLLDQFGSQVKTPGVFRFELYQHIPRSAEPKGKRVIIWPDVDLTDPVKNNDYWLDFLRAYEFNLPCELAGSQNYILQATCLCPNGKRLSTEFTLRKAK